MKPKLYIKYGRKTYEFATRGDVGGDCWPECAMKKKCRKDYHPCDNVWWAAKAVMDHFTGLKEVTE